MRKLNILHYLFLIPFTLVCVFIFNIDSEALHEEVTIKEGSVLARVVKEEILDEGSTESNESGNVDPECGAYFTRDLIDLLQDVFDIIKFVDVVLVLVLTIVTFTQAIVKGGDDLKKAITITIKRVVIGVTIFFIPTLINFIFQTVGLYGTCGIR